MSVFTTKEVKRVLRAPAANILRLLLVVSELRRSSTAAHLQGRPPLDSESHTQLMVLSAASCVREPCAGEHTPHGDDPRAAVGIFLGYWEGAQSDVTVRPRLFHE